MACPGLLGGTQDPLGVAATESLQAGIFVESLRRILPDRREDENAAFGSLP